MMKKTLGWLVLLLGLILAPSALGQTADLRPRFTAGQTDRFDFVQEGHLTLDVPSVPDASAEQTISQEMRIALKIDEVSEEGAKGTITFERIALTLQGGGMDVEFDSNDPASGDGDNPVAPTLRSIVGKSIGVTFDEAGNVTALSGLEQLGGAGGFLGDLLGKDALKGQVARVTALGEGAAVRRVGEEWTSKDVIELPEGAGRLEMTTKHRLKSVRAGKATVTIEAELASKGKTEGITVRESSIEGKYVWDTERGMVDSLEFDEVQDFEVEQSGVKARVKQDVTRKITRVQE